MSLDPTDVSLPQRKPEDTSAGCRMLASDDRERAEQSDSAHMRLRLVSSADTWTLRAAARAARGEARFARSRRGFRSVDRRSRGG